MPFTTRVLQRRAAPSAPLVQPRLTTTQQTVLAGLDPVFAAISAASLSPPQVTRVFYLYFMSVTTAWNWNTRTLTGTNDGWNWSTQGESISLATAVPLISQVIVGLVNGAVPLVSNTSPWATAWAAWFNARQADGSAINNTIKAGQHLPNDVFANGVWSTTYLKVDEGTTQNVNSFLHPDQWTPLEFTYNGVTSHQPFAGMNWRDVSSTMVFDEAAFDTMTDCMVPDVAARMIEVVDVKTILNDTRITPSIDERKVIAEFWAQGPSTITPPGFSIWLWKDYVETFAVSDTVFFKSGLDLAISQFEVGRLTWRAKLRYMQARPIQEIRSRYKGQQVDSWNGRIDGGTYKAFQEPGFATPPFPDLPSGHSAFAQICANTMTKWFGASISGGRRRRTGLNQLSPMLNTLSTQTAPYATFTIPRRSSQIQATVPARPITLSYNTWQETADDSGISRQYGGVHCLSAHYVSQAIANMLSPIINTHWNLNP